MHVQAVFERQLVVMSLHILEYVMQFTINWAMLARALEPAGEAPSHQSTGTRTRIHTDTLTQPHCSLFPVPCSLFPVPCSLFPFPFSLLSSSHLGVCLVSLRECVKPSDLLITFT